MLKQTTGSEQDGKIDCVEGEKLPLTWIDMITVSAVKTIQLRWPYPKFIEISWERPHTLKGSGSWFASVSLILQILWLNRPCIMFNFILLPRKVECRTVSAKHSSQALKLQDRLPAGRTIPSTGISCISKGAKRRKWDIVSHTDHDSLSVLIHWVCSVLPDNIVHWQ